MEKRELHEQAKEKMKLMYILDGIAADASQLSRAVYRNDKKGAVRNINQIIRKLAKAKFQL